MKETEEEKFRKNQEASASLKQQTRILEGDLLEFLMNHEVEYLRNWAFEYGDYVSTMTGIDRSSPTYDYIQTYTRFDLMKRYWNQVDEFVRNYKDKEKLVRVEITLPLMRDIKLIAERNILKNRK